MSQGLQASEQESGEGLEMIIGQAPDEGREGGGTIKSYQGAQRSCQGGLRQ